jgi:hypothetical protein
MPEQHELPRVQNDFFHLARFPRVIGAIVAHIFVYSQSPGARCTIFKNLQVTKYKLQVIS